MLSDFGVYIVAIIKNWLGFVGAGLTMLGLVALANPRRGERVSYWARRFLLPLGLVLLFGAQFSAWRAERGRAETLGPETFSQPGHNLLLGDAVFVDAGGQWRKAKGDSEDTLAAGIVTSVHGDSVTVANSGFLRIRHRLGQAGQHLWLSQSEPGGITAETPAAGIWQAVGVIQAPDLILINIGMAEVR